MCTMLFFISKAGTAAIGVLASSIDSESDDMTRMMVWQWCSNDETTIATATAARMKQQR